MEQRSLSFREAKQISIVEYLSGLGIEPAKIRGADYWYYAPYREERIPSFKVNTKHNIWYDHGEGIGGTILDLGARLHRCSLVEFVEKLSKGYDRSNLPSSLQQPRFKIVKPENKLEVVSVETLSSPNLVHYLKTRGIDLETARQFCKEVEFRIEHNFYSAIGFPNNSGAFELRNSWFKGSSSPKDVSIIRNVDAADNSNKISVLEGFMDFLSLIELSRSNINPNINRVSQHSDFLILNSIQLLNRSLPLLTKVKEVNLFLDNDEAAVRAKNELNLKGICYNDASTLYSNHKDVNAYWVSQVKERQGHYQSRSRSLRVRR